MQHFVALYRKIISSPTKMIMLGYGMIILIGTVLLMMPASSAAHVFTPFKEALFTATSATCVTGLVLFDTFTYWSMFGQLVILGMIQIGGIGFMTLTLYAISLTKKKIGLRERVAMQEAVSAPFLSGMVRLTRFILYSTVLFEGIGAFLFALRFCPVYGLGQGIYMAVFQSVSSFCNAGFDLVGMHGQFSSLMPYQNDPLVNLVTMALVIIGGLGFYVWFDLRKNGLHIHRYTLHTKIVLLATITLIVVGALAFYFLERDGVLAEKSAGEQFLNSMFQSVSPRTAGFNTVPMGLLAQSTQFVIIILMLIGGSPGSTAGGIKTTTVTVMFLSVFSELRKRKAIECHKRRLPDEVLKQAACILMLYLIFFLLASIVMSAVENLPMNVTMFECASAIGTVGLSLGVTPALSTFSHVVLICLMFFGRVGGLTVLFAFSKTYPNATSQLPQEKITVG